MWKCPRTFAAVAVALLMVTVPCAAEDEDGNSLISEAGLRALEQAEASLAASPESSPQHGGAITYLYGAGHPEMVCAPYRICRIALERGEHLLPAGVHIGDSTRWNIEPILGAGDQTFLVVKPTVVGIKTNLAIHTNRRSYDIAMISDKERYMPIISFRYPSIIAGGAASEPARSPLSGPVWDNYYANVAQSDREDDVVRRMTGLDPAPSEHRPGVSLAELDYRYNLDVCRRCKRFAPKAVFNDGSSTWIVLPDGYSGDLPNFVLNARGASPPVQSRWHEQGQLQVEAVFERGFLVLGRKKVEIEWEGATSTRR